VTPEEQVAALLVERYDLRPPVDVLAVAERLADVDECEWPFDCDGVAVKLTSSRPRIFLRSGANRRRQRFTLAHEVGHVILGWHVGTVACTSEISVGQMDMESASPFRPGIDQEGEANRFASRLLVPDRFLQPLTHSYKPVPEMLDALATADVSAAAGILALRQRLLPGYLFDVGGLPHRVASTGTQVDEAASDAVLRRRAKEAGEQQHQGQLVRWYQFVDTIEAFADDDPRSTSEILTDAIITAGDYADVKATWRRITSIVGGVLSRPRHIASEGELLGILVHRFDVKEWVPLFDVDDFVLYLHRKARDVAARRQAEQSQ
jgi:IrrE N-terminal-like domain